MLFSARPCFGIHRFELFKGTHLLRCVMLHHMLDGALDVKETAHTFKERGNGHFIRCIHGRGHRPTRLPRRDGKIEAPERSRVRRAQP